MVIAYPTRASPGLWIKAHLDAVGEDSVYDMWHGFVKFSKGFTGKYKFVSYNKFRSYINMAKQAGLIVPTRRGPSTMLVEGAYKQFYKLVQAKLEASRWKHLNYEVREDPPP
jgi:hypothetical protein